MCGLRLSVSVADYLSRVRRLYSHRLCAGRACVHRYPAERISILSTYNGQVAPATHRLEVAYFKTLEP